MNNQWTLRVLSAALALVLYFFVHSQNNSSVISLVLPVELQNVPEDMVVLLPESRQAKVTLRGPSFLMSDLVSQPPVLKVKLPQPSDRRVEVTLGASNLSVNSALEVLTIDPPKMEIILDRLIHVELPVDVPRIGSVPDGYKVLSIQAQPSRVKVEGAETEVRNLKSVETYPLDLRNVVETFSTELAVRSPGKYNKVSAARVLVDVVVESLSTEKVFEQIPVAVNGKLPSDISLEARQVRVEVSGLKDRVAALAPGDIQASVDVKPNPDGTWPRRVNVKIDLPSSVSLVVCEPSQIRLIKGK